MTFAMVALYRLPVDFLGNGVLLFQTPLAEHAECLLHCEVTRSTVSFRGFMVTLRNVAGGGQRRALGLSSFA